MGLKFRSPIVRKGTVNSSLNRASGFSTRFIGYSNPTWVNVQQNNELAKIYSENPIVYAVITLKASMMSNGIVNVRDLKTGEVFTRDSIRLDSKAQNKQLITKALNLIESPNVLQSRKEFITMSSIIKDVFGNQFTYFNSGTIVDIRNVVSLWNIYPQYMSVLLQGNYFNATNTDEIIKGWRWEGFGSDVLPFNPDEIMLRKSPNVQLCDSNDLVFGMSPLVPLHKPISNIAIAYESENVVLKNRGARILMSLARQQDQQSGVEPARKEDLEEVQNDWGEYGLRDDQKQAFITRQPIDVTVLDQDVRKLGISETIGNNSMAINNTYGISPDLLPLWIQGSTFENQRQAEKRTYQAAIIPEFNDWLSDLDDRLKMQDNGLQYVANWDHIGVLQEDKKEMASSNSITSKYHESMYMKGAIVLNTWLQAVGLPDDEKYGKKRVFELSAEERQAIGISVAVKSI